MHTTANRRRHAQEKMLFLRGLRFSIFFFFLTRQVGAKECKKLRELAENCGMSLDKEGDLDLSARKTIFEIEVCTPSPPS